MYDVSVKCFIFINFNTHTHTHIYRGLQFPRRTQVPCFKKWRPHPRPRTRPHTHISWQLRIYSFGSYFFNYKLYGHNTFLMTSVNFMNKCQKAMPSVKIMSHVNLREGCLEACLGRSLRGLLRAVLEGCLGRS